MASYETLKHDLDNKMLRASSLTSEQDQQEFVAQTFKAIHQQYQGKQINHITYVKLINHLGASYKRGSFNDYVDTLAGAAQLGMLDQAMQGGGIFSPESARQRSEGVTRLTGVDPVKPEEE